MVFGAVVLAEHVDLHLAEIARKGDLRGLRQVDVTEQNQLIVEEGFIDLGEQRRRYRLFERDAGDLAAEHRMQRLTWNGQSRAAACGLSWGLNWTCATTSSPTILAIMPALVFAS